MKFAITTLIAAAAFLVAADEYPHAFPRTGATKLMDNDRITVWEVNWLKNVMQPVHRHRYDMAGVYLRFGQITVTKPDEPVPEHPKPGAVWEVPRPYFQPKGVTHREVAFGGPNDPERLAIMVDLKDESPATLPVPPGSVAAFPREGAKDVLNNARVIEWDYTWKPNVAAPMHFHDKDAVMVFVEGGTLNTHFADGHDERTTVNFKDVRYIPRGRVDSETAIAGSPPRHHHRNPLTKPAQSRERQRPAHTKHPSTPTKYRPPPTLSEPRARATGSPQTSVSPPPSKPLHKEPRATATGQPSSPKPHIIERP